MNRRYEPASQLLVFTIEYLVDMIRRGHVRTPAYARRYVWNQDQTIALLDSIARGYPIGTMLFSEGPAPSEEVIFGPLKITAPAEERAYWIVDGQQRLVSLAAVLSNSHELDRRFAIAFDLRAESFVPTPPKRDPYVVPLYILFDSTALRRWFSRAPVDIDSMELASDVAWNIRRYQIAAYVIQNENPAVTMQIFERLNTSGVSLRPTDLFSAFVTAGSPSSSRNIDNTVRLISERTGFGNIDENTVMRSILAVRSDDVTSISRIAHQDLGSAFDEGEDALNRAVVFLQETSEVPHVTFLASHHLLVALTRFFAIHPNPDIRHLRLLRRWLWRASVVASDSNQLGGNLGVLRKYLRSISVDQTSRTLQSMLQNLPTRPPDYPPVGTFRPGGPATRMLLSSWWSLGPREPRNGRKVTRSELSAAIGENSTARRATHAIFSDAGKSSSRTANRVLLPAAGEIAKSLYEVFRRPSENLDYFEWLDVLRSHCITEQDFWALQEDRIEDFMEIREHTVEAQFHIFLDSLCEWGLEDTPSLNDLIIGEGENDGFA
jgi:hypothetical protein